jgi:Ca2+/Na+ antiporter
MGSGLQTSTAREEDEPMYLQPEDLLPAVIAFSVGLFLIMIFAEQLVKGVVGTSIGFGLSTFLLSVIFIGFDPDNLAMGTVASAEELTDIALGSILGGAMVAVAFAFGLAALVAPMTLHNLGVRGVGALLPVPLLPEALVQFKRMS